MLARELHKKDAEFLRNVVNNKLPNQVVEELLREMNVLNDYINSLSPESWSNGYADGLQRDYDYLVLRKYPEAVEELREYVEQDVINNMSKEDYEEAMVELVENQKGWWFEASVNELLDYCKGV